MSKTNKRLYLVKREVYANSIQDAVFGKGHIYEITMADERYQPEYSSNKKVGFKPKNELKTR